MLPGATTLPGILSVILDPSVGNEQRRFAHEQLEIFKTRRDALETFFRSYSEEYLAERRESVLHCCLRLAADILRQKYSELSLDEAARIKTAVLQIISQQLSTVSVLVEAAAVDLAVEILKDDLDPSGFFEILVQGIRSPAWSRIACTVLSTFSEVIIVEDEEAIVGARRAKLTRFFVSMANRVLAAALDVVESCLQYPQPDHRLLAAVIILESECLRWNEPPAVLSERLLKSLVTCCAVSMPVQVSTASFHALRSICACKPADLEKSKIPPLALYQLIRPHVLDGRSFRSDDETYAATECLFAMMMTHHQSLPLDKIASDLEMLTMINNPFVLSDALDAWKHLLQLEKPKLELTAGNVNIVLRQCVACAKAEGEEEEETNERNSAIKEFVKRRPDLVCPAALNLVEALLENGRYKEAWILVEPVCNGLAPKHFDSFVARDISSPAFVQSLEGLLDLLFKKCSEQPISADKLKLLHSSHRLFEVRGNYVALALEVFSSSALTTVSGGNTQSRKVARDIRKRAAAFLLSTLRRINARKGNDAFLASTVLPTLIQRVSATFPTLDGPEKFVMLESILVAGKALPNEADRVNLTRNILTEPFQVLSSLKNQVFSQLLVHDPPGTASKLTSTWDSRGYFADIEALPVASRQFAYALMTLSTCSQDGQLTLDMWMQLVPVALETLYNTDRLWTMTSPESTWSLVMHPVDAICLLGGRMAETMENFVEGLNDFGETVLGPERCAIIAFFSSNRSCSLELLKNAWIHKQGCISAEQASTLLSNINTMENRHLASLLGAIPFHLIEPRRIFDELVNVVSMRLNAPRTPAYSIRPFPNCPKELFEVVDDAAYVSLEMAFAKLLRSACPLETIQVAGSGASVSAPVSDSVLTALCERLTSKDLQVVRHVAQTIHERCYPMNRFTTNQMINLVMRGCLIGMAKLEEQGLDTRPVLDLAAETLCRVIFSVVPKELGKTKRQQPVGKGKNTWQAELSSILGASLVSKFVEELGEVHKSEKAFKASVQDMMTDATKASRAKNGSASLPIQGTTASMATEPQSKRNRKKKKKNKETVMADGMVDSQANQQGSWHAAADARDLGTLLLFGGSGEMDDDL